MKTIIEIINSDKVANVFFNLYERWLDEHEYEDINDYGRFLFRPIAAELVPIGADIKMTGCTKKPFGIKVSLNGNEYHIFVKMKGRNAVLCCNGNIDATELPQVVSDYEYNEMTYAEKKEYTRPHFVYAHGNLEEDMKIDLVMVRLNGKELADGLEAEYKGKKCVFHLYDHSEMRQKTGVVTYADDKEACEYGRKLVETRPAHF